MSKEKGDRVGKGTNPGSRRGKLRIRGQGTSARKRIDRTRRKAKKEILVGGMNDMGKGGKEHSCPRVSCD